MRQEKHTDGIRWGWISTKMAEFGINRDKFSCANKLKYLRRLFHQNRGTYREFSIAGTVENLNILKEVVCKFYNE
jgi:hypothetical protein